MKRWILVLLVCLLSSSAQADIWAEMEIPETVEVTINGEVVSVPVVVPDVEHLPVYSLTDFPVDVGHLADVYGEEHLLHTVEGAGRLTVVMGGADEIRLQVRPVEDPAAENNAYSMEDAQEWFMQEVKRMNLPSEFSVYRTVATSVSETLGTGGYRMAGVQLCSNVPVFYGSLIGNYIHSYFFSKDCWEISMTYMHMPGEIIQPDAELVPFEEMVSAIQQRIDDGMLLSVDSIELWYGKQCFSKKDYRYVPCWRVMGYDTHISRYSKTFRDDPPTAFERYCRLPPSDFCVNLDAATAQPIRNGK